MSKSIGPWKLDSDCVLAPSAAPLLLLAVVAVELFSGGVLPTQVPSDLFIL